MDNFVLQKNTMIYRSNKTLDSFIKNKEITFNKLHDLQLLIKKESGLKELCKYKNK